MELIDKAKLYDEISRLEKMAMANANEKEQYLQAYLININSLNERTMMKYLVADFPTVEPPKGECTKEVNGYHMYIRCACGCEISVDAYYWKDFLRCPTCGADMRSSAK